MPITADELRLTATLLRSRLQMLSNSALRQSRERRGWTVVIVVIVLGAMVGGFHFAQLIFGFSAHAPADLQTLVAGALLLLAGLTAATSLTFALSSLYFSSDLEQLHVAPLRPRVLILSRLYTQLGLGVALGVAIGGPPLLAYLLAVHRLAALPLVALLVVGAVTAPLALATGVVVVGLRAVPARYARDAGGLVVTVAVFVIAAINVLGRSGTALPSGSAQLPFQSLGSGLLASVWSPIGWAARGICDAIGGEYLAAVPWLVALLVLPVLLPLVIAIGVERAYSTGYRRNAIAARGARRKGGHRRGRRLPPRWLVLATKDLRQLRRDASQLGQMALPLALFAFYLGTPGHTGLNAGALPWWYLLSLNASAASLLFATNLALRGIGMEGQRMWLLRSSPMRARDLLAAKYSVGVMVAALPAFALFWIGAVRNGDGLVAALPPTVVVGVIITGVVALAVMFGSLRPRLDWSDPRRAVGIGTTVAFLLAGAVYLVACYVALALTFVFAGDTLPVVMLSVALLAMVTALVVAAGLWVAAARLSRLQT